MGYDFGPAHPLRPVRYRLTRDLMDASGLLGAAGAQVIPPRPAQPAELEAVHEPAYIKAVANAGHNSGSGAPGMGLGAGDNPVFPEMHEVSSLVAGGSVRAAEMVLNGKTSFAFNIAGGLHHALPARASGFCIYNDPAVAIAWLLSQGLERILYLDTDAHHGDGVQWIFYRDPRVMTISIHESGRFLFPGTGDVDEIGSGPAKGTSINVPLDPGASDADVLLALDEVALPLAAAFQPQFVVLQHGCDAHRADPLTHLECSLHVFPAIAERERHLVERSGGMAIGGGGGGYAYRDVVPLAWTTSFAQLTGLKLPDRVPDTWEGASDLPFDTFDGDEPGPAEPLPSTRKTIARLWRELGHPQL